MTLCSSSGFAEAPHIKIGALFHLTGEWAVYGNAFREGAELATRQINQRGGIDGHAVDLIFEDTEYKPQMAHSGAKKLAEVDKIDGALVSTLTEIEAAGPVLQKARVPTIVLWDSSREIEAIGDYIFSIGPSAELSGETVARFAFDTLKSRKAIIFDTNTSFSLAVSKSFSENFRAAGGKIAASFSFNPDELDFRTVLQKAKTFDFDFIYAPIDANLFSFFKQLRELHLTAPVVNSDTITQDNLQQGGEIFERVYESITADPDFSETVKLLRDYKEFFKRDCTQVLLVAWGYDGVMLLAEAKRRSLSSGQAINQALRGIRDYAGTTGPISFNARGSAPKRPTMFQIVDRKYEAAVPPP